MLNDRIVRTAFMISFIGHFLFLGMPGFNIDPSQLKQPKDVTVRIKIEKPPLLPKIDVMGEEKKLKEIAEKPDPEFEPEPQPEEIVMEEPPKELTEENIKVIDPIQKVMLRYQDMIKQKIESCRKYPNRAKKQGFEGISHLTFTLLSSGMVQDIKIIHSSGFDIFDEEAVSTVKRASPFKPIPEKFNYSNLTIEVALVFQLK